MEMKDYFLADFEFKIEIAGVLVFIIGGVVKVNMLIVLRNDRIHLYRIHYFVCRLFLL